MRFWGLFLCLLAACTSADQRGDYEYAFWVAGHTYGKAGKENAGLHPPFMAELDKIKNQPRMSFGVLTGDIVLKGSREDWEDVERDIEKFGMPIHFALGNHEYLNPGIVSERFQPTYYSFWKNRDLHILLDPNLDHWNISGEQLTFLQNTLKEANGKVRNLFVYMHQVLWWSPDNAYANILVNSPAGRSEHTNFWSEVVPLLEDTNRPVYCFAGDVGAANWAEDYTDHQFGNLRLIASGMGKDIGSNYLIVQVPETGKPWIKLIDLEAPEPGATELPDI